MVRAWERAHARPSAVQVAQVCADGHEQVSQQCAVSKMRCPALVHLLLVGDPRMLGAPGRAAYAHDAVRAWQWDSERANWPALT